MATSEDINLAIDTRNAGESEHLPEHHGSSVCSSTARPGRPFFELGGVNLLPVHTNRRWRQISQLETVTVRHVARR